MGGPMNMTFGLFSETYVRLVNLYAPNKTLYKCSLEQS